MRLLDDAQTAQFDVVDERETEVRDQQTRDLVVGRFGAGKVQPEPRSREAAAVREADVEVEVGTVLGCGRHGESIGLPGIFHRRFALPQDEVGRIPPVQGQSSCGVPERVASARAPTRCRVCAVPTSRAFASARRRAVAGRRPDGNPVPAVPGRS